MTMGKKSLHLYHHFGKKIIFIQTTCTNRLYIYYVCINTMYKYIYNTVKTNIIPTTSV